MSIVISELTPQQKETFENIPGMKEVKEERHKQYANEWQAQHRAKYCPDAVYCPAYFDVNVSEVEARYPDAVFALNVKRKYDFETDEKLKAIYKSAYMSICNGEEIGAVKAALETALDQSSEERTD